MNKIRTMVAHEDKEIRDTIVNSISDLEFLEIVGVASDGISAYQKMIDLKPEIVFSKYNYSNIPGIELIKKTKEELKDKFPSFNTIGEIPDNEIMEVMSITNNKINACVVPPYGETAKNIIKAYKEYKDQ